MGCVDAVRVGGVGDSPRSAKLRPIVFDVCAFVFKPHCEDRCPARHVPIFSFCRFVDVVFCVSEGAAALSNDHS